MTPTLKLANYDLEQQALPASSPTGRWITARDAQQRSGLNLGSINRLCLQDWQHRGLARRDRLPSGQPGWWIDEAADPRFVAAPTAETKNTIFDPAKLGLTDAQTQEVFRRRKIVADWNDAVRASAAIGLTERQVTDQFLARRQSAGTKLSRATLYNWLRDWRKQGVRGLIDARWKAQHPADNFAEFMALGTQLYLDRGRLKPKSVCHEIASYEARRNGWSIPAYGTFCRLLDKLHPALVARQRHGDKRFTDDHEPNIRRDYSTIAANDWWCSDHRPFDVFVRHGHKADGSPSYIRPILHAWQDLRSRRLLAWEILAEAPNTPIILRTFVNACDQHGVPKIAYVDNGKDYDAKSLQGVTKRQRRRGETAAECEGAFNVLGVEPIHAWPFHGQSKPIERLYNTISSHFCKLWDTYSGRSTTAKPEWMLRSESRAATLANAPTLQEFTAAFNDWAGPAYNLKTGHLGDAMDHRSPAQCFADELKTKRTLPRDLLEFATFARTKPVTVSQDGVRYQGISFGQFDQKLAALHGKKVKLAVDDRDLSHVYVLDLGGRLICRAKANGKIGFVKPGDVTDATLRDAIAEKKRLRKSLKTYVADRPRMALDVPDLAIRAARQRAEQAAPPAPTDAPIEPVRTPFDDQFSAIQQAMPGATAAQQRATELAALDDLRPSYMRIAGDESAEIEDEEIFGALTSAMRKQREAGA